jgi:hypothetical protein
MAVAVAQACDIGPVGFVGNWTEEVEHLLNLWSVSKAAAAEIDNHRDQPSLLA